MRNLFFFLCIFLHEVFLVIVVVGVKMGLEVSEFDSYCCEESVVGIDLRRVVCECKSSVCWGCWGFQVLSDLWGKGM
jgi:hypothetical protein